MSNRMSAALRAPVSWQAVGAVLLPFIVWLLSIAWSSKLDRRDFDQHMIDHAVQAEKLNEILCTIKPQSKHCSG